MPIEFYPTQSALAIHTSSPELGLALSNCAGEYRHQTWELGRALSTHLHLHLAEFIHPQAWSDLAFIAVAKGPGSFTSNRIGVVTARTLAQQLEIPLFAISTLAASAWSHAKDRKEAIAVQMPAQRGEIFGGIYQVDPLDTGLKTLVPDSVMAISAWEHTLKTWNTPYHLIHAEGNLGADVMGVLELAHHQWLQGERPQWSEALPFYGQQPV
ncbi:MAG: tRNA (adenosine(37)-N6)-threonylcarbamoyltransferase complex dimerization subunit type 1 TsaB [Leptolyngbyaceae bacterium]|nr:tRNA (adenosine(37)-N6)-threonylcarbamoyltransferase complex dimerization subunit type 1 TsaB [Leptolyngbyaceae bacterium]